MAMALKLSVIDMPTELDMMDEFEKLKAALAGRLFTPQLQAYVIDEITSALMEKVSLKAELL